MYHLTYNISLYLILEAYSCCTVRMILWVPDPQLPQWSLSYGVFNYNLLSYSQTAEYTHSFLHFRVTVFGQLFELTFFKSAKTTICWLVIYYHILVRVTTEIAVVCYLRELFRALAGRKFSLSDTPSKGYLSAKARFQVSDGGWGLQYATEYPHTDRSTNVCLSNNRNESKRNEAISSLSAISWE